MEAKHTPGPWQALDADGCAASDSHKLHVFGADGYVSRCNTEADARLIAAAPELLEALNKLLRDADSEPDGEYLQGANKGCVAVHRSGIERARAAIAKATGASQ